MSGVRHVGTAAIGVCAAAGCMFTLEEPRDTPDASVDAGADDVGTAVPSGDAPASDAVAIVVDDAGAAPFDAAGDALVGDPYVGCRTSFCTLPSQLCCISGSTSCTAPSACSSLPVECNNDQNCVALGQPDGICCAVISGNELTAIRCLSAAECVAPNHPRCAKSDPDASCAPGATCTTVSRTFGIPNGTVTYNFGVCSAP